MTNNEANMTNEMKEFFETDIPENTEDLEATLKENVREYNSLTSGKNVDYKGHAEYVSITKYIDSLYSKYPPIKLIEDLIKHYTQKKLEICNFKIPDIMRELGLNKVTMDDGTDIKIKKEVNVQTQNRDNFLKWLKSVGNEDDVKNILSLPKGEFDDDLQNFLASNGYTYEIKEDCHHQTIKKIVKNRLEQLEQNENKTLHGKELSEVEKKFAMLPPAEIATISTFEYAEIKIKE